MNVFQLQEVSFKYICSINQGGTLQHRVSWTKSEMEGGK